VLPEMTGLLDAYLGPTRTTTEERRT
jgi:hypothetical protein